MESKSELWRAIESYGEGMERVVLSTLMAINQKVNVINLGGPGQGKSFCTAKLCDRLGVEYKLVAGHKSPKDFFEIFKYEGLVIIDESATLIRDPKIMDMLLTALWESRIEWSSSKEHEIVEFKGNIIFNTNSLPNNAFMEALKDRCIFNKLDLSRQQLKNIYFKKNEECLEEWAVIKENLSKNEDLTVDEINAINEMIKKTLFKSLRTPIKTMKAAKFLKNVFGGIDRIDLFIGNEDSLFDTIKNAKSKKELAKDIMTMKHVSLRQAYNIIKKGENDESKII